jgi:thioredoxin-like negative regulator of GroEL
VIPSIPAFPLPRHAHGREPADPETFKRLMAEARDAMSRGEAGEAMGKYGAALGMDPGNQEAREGMKAATLLLGETIARRVMSASPSPSPH